ncbi:MAG: hypothetical protein IPG94_21425 [Kineosporiaceae bacterium]|nr:hypothetical protein [Kineosporiaceae bacterium]
MTRTTNRSAVERAIRTGRVMAPRPGSAGERQLVPAVELAAACCSGGPSTPSGLRLRGVRVRGGLDLAHADVPFPISFEGCVFDEPVQLHGAHLPALTFEDCELPALVANGLQVDHDLVMSGSVITEPVSTAASESAKAAVWLCEADVGGRVLMVGTRIEAPGQRSIQADRMVVGGTMRLIHGFTARGEVRLIGAQVHGSLDLTGAHLIDPYAGLALDLGGAHIDGSVFIIPRSGTKDRPDGEGVGRSPLIDGRIDAGNAVIGSRFVIRDTTIHGTTPTPGTGYYDDDTDPTALHAAGLRVVGGGVEFQGDSLVEGKIELEGCDIALLSVSASVQLRAPGLDAIRLSTGRLRSGLFLAPGLNVQGSLRFTGAEIGGNVALAETTWSHPSKHGSVTGQGSLVRGEVSLQGMVTHGGAVNLRGSVLRGTVNFAGAVLDNPTWLTVDLHQADVVGSVILDDVTSTGCVLLSRARIAGELSLDGAELRCGQSSFRNPAKHALNAEFAGIQGGMRLHWTHVEPSVSFEGVDTTVLADDPRTWPPQAVLSGFTYQRFQRPDESSDDRRWDIDARLSWLATAPMFDPGPYEQLARVLRARAGCAVGACPDRSSKPGIPRPSGPTVPAYPSLAGSVRGRGEGCAVCPGPSPATGIDHRGRSWRSSLSPSSSPAPCCYRPPDRRCAPLTATDWSSAQLGRRPHRACILTGAVAAPWSASTRRTTPSTPSSRSSVWANARPGTPTRTPESALCWRSG